MKKPLIAITQNFNETEFTYGIAKTYVESVKKAGGIPVLLTFIDDKDLDQLVKRFDGFIFTGGPDMEPNYFGEQPVPALGTITPSRDYFEVQLAKAVLKSGKPILGICRGHQLFNLLLGGSLMQDLPAALLPFHDPQAADAAGDLRHSIACAEGSFLARVYGRLTLCNSSHHQALTAVGRGMRVTAWTESGLIEASEHESLPILTLQFHPERMEEGGPVFDWLLAACRAPS